MSTWILIIALTGGYFGTTPAVTTAEFTSEARCMAAAAALLERASLGRAHIGVACVLK